MTVTPINGERFCYLVSSESGRSEGYRVDMLANKGLGHCSCENWGVVRWKNVKQGIPDYCKHQQAVRNSVWLEMMKDLYKTYETSPHPKTETRAV
jgi:hypothetical protein